MTGGHEWAKANRSILVVLGLGVIVYWPDRKSASLYLFDKKTKLFHCLDCQPETMWDVAGFRDHLQTHTKRKAPYPVFVSPRDGKLYEWPQQEPAAAGSVT